MAFAARGVCVSWVLWAHTVLAWTVDKPAECPMYQWHTECRYQATCESLAVAGLTCAGVADVEGCEQVCASPCCITTSTTTGTATSTGTTVTATHTMTDTATSTSITSTATHTTTLTDTETTDTETSVTTVTDTVTSSSSAGSAVSTTTTGTPGPTTTTEQGPAALMRVTMRVAVQDPDDYMDYFTDPKVAKAYVRVMMNITGARSDQIDLEMDAKQLGNITIVYTITIPYMDNGTMLVPSMPLSSMQASLAAVDMDSLSSMINEAMDAETGPGIYKQQVLSVVETIGGVADVSGVRAARLFATSTLLGLALLQIFRR
mmetsp:Transcript_33573/g.62907  ORF Transcript_33573/g.62907 Transcript_33573/m.62907 type:complete len:318 (-) Transcript_33573:160-1113(-)